MYSFDEVKSADPAVAEAIQLEIGRQNGNIELIASENFVSKAVMAAMGSPSPTNMPKAIRASAITADASMWIL